MRHQIKIKDVAKYQFHHLQNMNYQTNINWEFNFKSKRRKRIETSLTPQNKQQTHTRVVIICCSFKETADWNEEGACI